MKKDTRTRNWTFIIYPESCAANWQEILQEQHINFAVSPLHDKDINPDGTVKKAHYHVLLSFKGKKSFSQILKITNLVKATIPQAVNSADALIRYFVHIDNPEKFQYAREDIEVYGDIDIIKPFKKSSDKYRVINEMIEFIESNDIVEYCSFANYCRVNNIEWFYHLCDNATFIIDKYIKSKRHSLKEQQNTLDNIEKWKDKNES